MPDQKMLSFALILCLGLGSPAAAIPASFEQTVAGTSMSCVSWSGKPVEIRSNFHLQTLGRAYSDREGTPVIELNFAVLNTFSSVVQKWWFEHECAHHQLPPRLNSEKRADCIAGRRLKKLVGSGVNAVISSFRREFLLLPGSHYGHLAGPERAELVLKCARFNRNA